METSKETLKFKMVETNVTVDADNKVTRPSKYEVISTGKKGEYLFPEFSSICEALVKKGFSENVQFQLVKNSKDEQSRELVGKSLAQCMVLGLRALNSQEAVTIEKIAFNSSPEKVDSAFADLARKVLANPQATATQKSRATAMLTEAGLSA